MSHVPGPLGTLICPATSCRVRPRWWGICTTLIGLVKIIEVRTGSRYVDEYGGLAALLFLVSALASYLAIRLSSQGRASAWCERIADLFFVAGLVSLTLISLLFAYEAI